REGRGSRRAGRGLQPPASHPIVRINVRQRVRVFSPWREKRSETVPPLRRSVMRSAVCLAVLSFAVCSWAAAPPVAQPVHWSFRPRARPEVARVKAATGGRTPIDAFVLARLEKARLRPAAPAERVALVRRLTISLTGLPPSPEEVESFVNDRSPDAYE